VSSSQLTRNACWGWPHTRSRHGHAIDHPLADQADITHSQTYPACEHCGAVQADGDLTKRRTDPPERIPAVPRWRGYRSPRRRTLPHSGRRGPNNSAALARIRPGSTPRPTLPSISKTVCQQPIPSSGWNTSPRSAGAPHRPASRIALADRSTPNAGTPRPNQAGSQTSRTTTQFDHRPPHVATRASTPISFLSNPGGDASSHPAETTSLRKLRCPVTRRGFDVV
jgi:hypothetical protein